MRNGRLSGRTRRAPSAALSVCVYTRGPADRLRRLLELVRPTADEIVLAVDRTGDRGVLDSCQALADKRFLVDSTPIADMLGWLMHQCRGDWILRLDEDEVPSFALLGELPDLITGVRVSQFLLTRRWLFGDERTFITSAPWQPNYVRRLVRNIPGLWSFPGRLHGALEVAGESRLVDLPIYHALPLLTTLPERRYRAAEYERAAPGIVYGGLPINDTYLPEHHDVQTAPVPRRDLMLIRQVLSGRGAGESGNFGAPVVDVPGEQTVRFCDARSVLPGTYGARVEFVRQPGSVPAGATQLQEVLVENLGDELWPANGGDPPIRLGYRWFLNGAVIGEGRAAFTEVVAPQERTRALIMVTAPIATGEFVLEVDVVHEGVRWFDVGAQARVEVTGPSATLSQPDGRLVVLGTHVFAEEVADIAAQAGLTVDAFVENWDRERCREPLLGRPVVWIDDAAQYAGTHVAVCAIGSPERSGFIAQAAALGLGFGQVIHPDVSISPGARLGNGVVVGARVVVAAGTEIGSHTILNRGVLIGHHTMVGDCVTISPGANIAGCTTVGDGAYVGMGATVLDRIKIGDRAVVGAGAVVTRDVVAGARVLGVPARPVPPASSTGASVS